MTAPVHRSTRPIRYSDCDPQGVVFNAHYLTFCDNAHDEYLEAIGISYPALVASGHDAYVVNADISWRSSYRPGDTAHIEVTCERAGRSSYVVRYELTEEQRSVATARITYVVVRTDDSGPTEIPAHFRAALLGEPEPAAAG